MVIGEYGTLKAEYAGYQLMSTVAEDMSYFLDTAINVKLEHKS